MPHTTSEVWVVAETFIGQFGTEAAMRAWEEVQQRRSRDELSEALFWIAVVTAILDWHRREPIDDETIH